MGVLYIYKLDSNKEPVSVLENGEHVFGRGPLLKCTDRRVSRNHGVINVSDDTATITSTHQNPCFYQAASSSTITILPKDTPVNVNSGDKFALLADSFWFRIKIVNSSTDEISLPTPHTSVHNSTNERLQGITTSNVEINNTNNVSEDSTDFPSSPTKRVHEKNGESKSCKKFKHEDGQGDRLFSILEDLEKDQEPEKVFNSEQTKREVISESEDENEICKTKEMASEPEKQSGDAVNSKVTQKKPQKKTPQKSGNDDELKAMLFSSDEDDAIEDCKKSDNDAKKSNENMNNAEDGEDRNKNNTDNNSGDKNDECNANEGESSNKNGKKVWRDRCWYGMQCYRKSASHLAEFCHPGDSDFDSDPNDDRPSCSYGAVCYRRNKEHRKDYKHPRNSQKPPKKSKDATSSSHVCHACNCHINHDGLQKPGYESDYDE